MVGNLVISKYPEDILPPYTHPLFLNNLRGQTDFVYFLDFQNLHSYSSFLPSVNTSVLETYSVMFLIRTGRLQCLSNASEFWMLKIIGTDKYILHDLQLFKLIILLEG